jgi:hypothetical protein
MKRSILIAVLLFSVCSLAQAAYQMNPYTGRLDNVGPFATSGSTTVSTDLDVEINGSLTVQNAGDTFIDGDLTVDGSIYAGGSSAIKFTDGTTTFATISSPALNRILVADGNTLDIGGGTLNGTSVGLLVKNNLEVDSNSYLARVSINSTSVGNERLRVYQSSDARDRAIFVVNAAGNGGGKIWASGQSLVVDAGNNGEFGVALATGTGNVSIGTTSSTEKLSVLGNMTITGEATITGISSDGSGKGVCIKANGALGTCSDALNASGVCTCG